MHQRPDDPGFNGSPLLPSGNPSFALPSPSPTENDPPKLPRLDVLTATGDKTGVSKPRSEVHRGRGLPPRGARVNLLREHRGAATAAPRRLQGLVARPVGHLQRRPRLRMGLLPLLRAYTTVKPLADRVFLKTKTAEQKTTGGILLPSTAQSKPQSGEVVAVGEGRTIGDSKVEVGIKVGAQVVYSKYAGMEVELNDSNHLILKEDDIIGILETEDVKDMKPLSDRVLIEVAVAEDKTAGGLLLTNSVQEKPSVGTVVAVGPGHLDEEGKRIPLPVSTGSSVLYSKYAGAEFKGVDGTNYIVLRVPDLMAILS